MLFPPKSKQQVRQPATVPLQSVHHCMAGGTEGNQPSRSMTARPAVMDGALVGCPTALTAIPVPREHGVTVAAKKLSRVGHLPVAAAAEPGDGRGGPAATEEARLCGCPQGPG